MWLECSLVGKEDRVWVDASSLDNLGIRNHPFLKSSAVYVKPIFTFLSLWRLRNTIFLNKHRFHLAEINRILTLVVVECTHIYRLVAPIVPNQYQLFKLPHFRLQT